ncbi:chromate transporter [Chengkuizengella axinellae]|uniref:Chromate transporter n=1 Tax=Chengkuizengella axinellae TaxID=3064388 RepID=A0ABT9IY77_9BACL|nr:chromate transporter [Chengkuizengella sp. 2205SS18-9]MDP5274312.1 chromate transporter [Chengkuizengella sp. 2205SS18-9]
MQQNQKGAKLLIHILISFLKISPITFGGGYAMIPAIEREIVSKRKWLDEAEMSDVLSISGSAPGGIGINAATFIGYRLYGVRGALAAVVGMTLPTFLIIFLLGLFFASFNDNEKVNAAFQGIQIAIIALVCYAGYKMARTSIYDKSTFLMLTGTLFVLLFLNIHPMFVIIGGGLTGIVIMKVKDQLGFMKNATIDQKSKEKYKYTDYYMGDGI